MCEIYFKIYHELFGGGKYLEEPCTELQRNLILWCWRSQSALNPRGNYHYLSLWEEICIYARWWNDMYMSRMLSFVKPYSGLFWISHVVSRVWPLRVWEVNKHKSYLAIEFQMPPEFLSSFSTSKSKCCLSGFLLTRNLITWLRNELINTWISSLPAGVSVFSWLKEIISH